VKKVASLIFGYNEYGLEIAKNVTHKYDAITIFNLNESTDTLKSDIPFDIESFDLSDDWDDIKRDYDLEQSKIFCALSDEAQNIFLTISLRSEFKNITIIALAKNNEDANKLTMAGASKVIPIVETSANIITDMLKKPIITDILHGILYENSKLKIEQIKIENEDVLNKKFPADINWSRDHGIIIISIIHKDMSSEFIYSSKAKHNYLKDGDILVAVGYENDLESFKKLLGSNI